MAEHRESVDWIESRSRFTPDLFFPATFQLAPMYHCSFVQLYLLNAA
jgi:hypothetical protein